MLESIGAEVEAVFESARPAVVKVKALHGGVTFCGSGFYINEKGHVITALAIIGDSQEVQIVDSSGSYRADVLGRDPRTGLAYLVRKLAISGSHGEKELNIDRTPYLKFAEDHDLKPSSPVIAIGYPLDLPPTPIFGFVTGFDAFYNNRLFATTHIRSDIGLAPGQLGGPMLNPKGEVVGMMVIAAERGRLSFAIPARAISKAVKDIAKYGKVRHGWVGIGVHESQDNGGGERKTQVSILFPNTPAEKSGLQVGDILLQVNGKEIRKPSDVLDIAYFSQVGEKVPVTVLRGDKVQTFVYEIVERPSPNLVTPPPAVAENANASLPAK
ncbi:MAG: S1C family serine protease [Methylacidiphilales bacterium]|nr:S1C family serine protease [Candidatus Methylacidiphilales bacterium]MDW8349884.1 S1C family serine protease [Verrucomicrobiae bacterium]